MLLEFNTYDNRYSGASLRLEILARKKRTIPRFIEPESLLLPLSIEGKSLVSTKYR